MAHYFDAAAGDWVCGVCGRCTDHCACEGITTGIEDGTAWARQGEWRVTVCRGGYTPWRWCQFVGCSTGCWVIATAMPEAIERALCEKLGVEFVA